MKKIGITGGSGFIGNHAINLLLEKKYYIKSCDLIEPKNFLLKNKNFKFKKISLFDEKKLSSFFFDVDCIIHLAASLGVLNTEKNPLECLDTNILGTKAILNVVSKNKIKRLIFSSSSEVYGDQDKFPIKENYEYRIKSNYGLSKITSEFYVKSYAKKFNFNYNIIRFFNIYGPGQKTNFVISKFIDQVVNSKNLNVYGNGSQIRAFCNVKDSVRGLHLILTKGKKNNIYNIGNNSEPISIYNLARLIKDLSMANVKIIKTKFENSDRPKEREIFKRYPDLSKIKKDTGYNSNISLNEGITELLKK
jgi:UDP-glucose 4-epimerase